MKYYEALENAKTLVKSSSATARKLQQALEDLKSAVSGLTTVKSTSTEGKIAKARSDLRALVDGDAVTKVTNKSKYYTSTSYSAFEDALKAAKTLLSKDDTIKQDVDDAKDALNTAITNLKLEADTDEHKEAVSMLDDAITKANGVGSKGAYTKTSWDDFDSARDKANKVKASHSSYTAKEIKTAATNLTSAIDNLKSAKETLLNDLNALIVECNREVEDEKFYIKSTYDEYEKAYEAALQTVSGDSADKIEEATNTLKKAKKALITVKEVFDALSTRVNGKISDDVDSALSVEDKPVAQMSAIESATNVMSNDMEELIDEAKGHMSIVSGENFDNLIELTGNANAASKNFKSVVSAKNYSEFLDKSNNVLDSFVKAYSELKSFLDNLAK